MGDDICAWFGVISSTASAVGSVIERKKCYGLGVRTKRRSGGIDGYVGVMARRKVSKSAQIIFNNQQRLVMVL